MTINTGLIKLNLEERKVQYLRFYTSKKSFV